MGGQPRGDLQKYERPVRMFSLDTVYSEQDLREFDERVRKGLSDRDVPRYVAEPKLDGASLEVVYEIDRKHHLAKLALVTTRGDGRVGVGAELDEGDPLENIEAVCHALEKYRAYFN